MRSEFEIWREELSRPKRTIAERISLWFDRPAPAAEPAAAPDPYRWWSIEELIALADLREAPAP